MRTTVNIDDDVLQAARELGRRNRQSIGAVLSRLARESLTREPAAPAVKEPGAFYGIQPLPRVPGKIVTNQMIDRLREEDAY